MQAIVPYLPDLWLFLIGFFLLYYAITDGSDLGVGMISLFAHSEKERSMLIASVQSTWHGNQTWLVILGGMLFGAFPLFYAVLLSALYVPLVVMLIGLVFRGVAFEFRDHSENKRLWGLAFSVGSLIASLGQGFALGGLLGGLQVENSRFAGSILGWINPFSALICLGVLLGYVMLGSNYLIMKTEGDFQDRCYSHGFITSLVTAFISLVVHVVTVARYPHLMRKWVTYPDVLYTGFFPLLALIAFIMLLVSLKKRREVAPIIWNALIILFSFVGLSVGMYPNMIPNVASEPVTVTAAAASPSVLMFMLVVTGSLIPVILLYTAYQFWVFHGKVEEGSYDGGDE